MEGTTGHVTYNVDTVEQIDGNLASLSPGHPDVNLLLDARLKMRLLDLIWPSAVPSAS